jgi:predicted DNA-binding transcriptional regulator AlpA
VGPRIHGSNGLPAWRLLPEREAARCIGMSVGWVRAGRGYKHPKAPPYLKIGRAVRYRIEDLDEWIDRCRVEPGGAA